MKSILELNSKKVPVVRKDKSLNQYSNKVLFPEKVEKAKQAFEKLGLPGQPNKNNR
jgi:hypothetical protein